MRTIHQFIRRAPPAWSAGWLLILLLLAALPALALAQLPREYEPGDDPRGDGGGSPWTMVSIPLAPLNTTLGDLWVDTHAGVYVWGLPPATDPRRIDPGDGGDPGAGGPVVFSTLYRFDGQTWTEALVLTGEIGTVVYGTGVTDVYAATNTVEGVPKLYRFDGAKWTLQELPHGMTGPASDIAGAPGDIYFRSGDMIARFDGKKWRQSHKGVDPKNHGLVYVGPDEVYAQCCNGHWVFDGRTWKWRQAFEFSHVMSTWGMRDPEGTLHLYATGCYAQDDGVRIWKYNEDFAGSLTGAWGCALDESGTPGLGEGTHLWGSGGADIYAVGTMGGCGCIHRFDGNAWTDTDESNKVAPARAVAGDGHANVWVSLANGQLMHFTQNNHRPDASAARAAVPELPANHRMVPLRIVGIDDADGDPVAVRVTGVTMDEPLDGRGDGNTCPDAVIHPDGTASLRAERSHHGNGRVYVVTFTADDGQTGAVEGYVVVTSPRHRDTPAVDDGQNVDATANCVFTAPEGAFEPGGEPKLVKGAGTMAIEFALAEPQDVRIAVFDLAGRQVGAIEGGFREAGAHSLNWNDAGVPSGVYFLHFRFGDQAFAKRVVLVR